MANRTLATMLALAVAAPLVAQDALTEPLVVVGERHFMTGYPARNADGTVNVVVECPAGTIVKWEVDKDGAMRAQPDRLGIGWDGLSTVDFLAFPANYGMIPGSLMAREAGGDGEPLDILVLGDAIPRGTVVAIRLIGAIALIDGREVDDKLIGVVDDSPLGDVQDVEDLKLRYPGAAEILETWLTSYKGAGKIVSRGFVGVRAAERLLDAGIHAYKRREADGH